MPFRKGALGDILPAPRPRENTVATPSPSPEKSPMHIKKNKRKPIEVGQVHKNIGVVVKPHRWPAAHNFARHALQEDDQAFAPSHGQRITFGRVGAHLAQYSPALVACACDLAWNTFRRKSQTMLCSTTAKVLCGTTMDDLIPNIYG